jgi:hypothetical protein
VTLRAIIPTTSSGRVAGDTFISPRRLRRRRPAFWPQRRVLTSRSIFSGWLGGAPGRWTGPLPQTRPLPEFSMNRIKGCITWDAFKCGSACGAWRVLRVAAALVCTLAISVPVAEARQNW